jgi:hypothetical protein
VRALELRKARAQQRADRRPYPSALQVLVDTIDARQPEQPPAGLGRLGRRPGVPEYDIYGWFNFETDAEGVQRLDRKWVPLAAAAAAEDFSDALDAYEERLEAKKKDFQ